MDSTSGVLRGAVLVLPGGKPDSWQPSRLHQLANLRMRPITERVKRHLGDEYAVEQVRYRHRGWNAPNLPALDDARQAIAKYRELPVVLIGHSMGGRVAAHLSAEVPLAGIVALAPWWPEDDGALITADRLVTIHGTSDRWTSPPQSLRQTREASDRGVIADYHSMANAGHFMLSNPRRWHDMVCESVTAMFAAHYSRRS